MREKLSERYDSDFGEELNKMGLKFMWKIYLETNREFLENVKGRIYTDKKWELYLNKCEVLVEKTKNEKYYRFVKKSLNRRTSDKYKQSQN